VILTDKSENALDFVRILLQTVFHKMEMEPISLKKSSENFLNIVLKRDIMRYILREMFSWQYQNPFGRFLVL